MTKKPKHKDDKDNGDYVDKDDEYVSDLTPEGGVPENYGRPDPSPKRTPGEVERTQRTIDLGARQLEVAPAGHSEGKEALLAPHATETALPRLPTQPDFWLGGQGKAQQESMRQDEEDRRRREELERSRAPTGRTLREQQAGEKQLAFYQSGGKREAEEKVGRKALKDHKGRLPDDAAA